MFYIPSGIFLMKEIYFPRHTNTERIHCQQIYTKMLKRNSLRRRNMISNKNWIHTKHIVYIKENSKVCDINNTNFERKK